MRSTEHKLRDDKFALLTRGNDLLYGWLPFTSTRGAIPVLTFPLWGVDWGIPRTGVLPLLNRLCEIVIFAVGCVFTNPPMDFFIGQWKFGGVSFVICSHLYHPNSHHVVRGLCSHISEKPRSKISNVLDFSSQYESNALSC